MITKRSSYIMASTNQKRDIQQAFDDFVDVDIKDIAVDNEQYNQLTKAVDILYAELKEILNI